MALHVDIPTRTELERLLLVRQPHCVSLYLPTSPVDAERAGDRIRLKNLVSEAVDQLRAAGVGARELDGIQEPLEELVDDEAFWSRLATSLAVFSTPERTVTFRLPNRLVAMVEVSDRFHLKPLLRAVTFPQAAFVLALSQGSVRLVEIGPEGPPHELKVPDLPEDVASAARKASIADRSPMRRLQGSEGHKVRIRQYARRVDEALRPVLAGHDLPLILAATEPLASIYRSLNTYPHLAPEGIGGNPDQTADAEMAAEARHVLDDLYAAQLAAVGQEFEARVAQGRSSTDLVDVARAATYGAVDTLLVDIDEVLPGRIDEESGAVTLADRDDAATYGIVDEIARRVLLTGGRVLAVRREDVPRGEPVAAILRYAV